MSEVQTQGGGGGKGLARPANGGESPRGKARGFRKVRLGRVVSDKMEKTVVVQVQDLKSHPLYKKVMKHRVRFKLHDERNEAKVGDLVRITETRPLSKEKRWRVVEIVEKAR